MRKIKTMADIERVRRRNNIILGLVMIFLLIASSMGYSLMSANSDSNNVVSENGFDFVRDGRLWKVLIGDETFAFQYLPSEVEDVDVELDVELEMYSGQPLYFVNSGEGTSEILSSIDRYILRYQESCLGNGGNVSEMVDAACNGNLPVKSCDSNLIIFEQGNDSRVYDEGNCVFIAGDVLRGSDAFLYEVLGIR